MQIQVKRSLRVASLCAPEAEAQLTTLSFSGKQVALESNSSFFRRKVSMAEKDSPQAFHHGVNDGKETAAIAGWSGIPNESGHPRPVAGVRSAVSATHAT